MIGNGDFIEIFWSRKDILSIIPSHTETIIESSENTTSSPRTGVNTSGRTKLDHLHFMKRIKLPVSHEKTLEFQNVLSHGLFEWDMNDLDAVISVWKARMEVSKEGSSKDFDLQFFMDTKSDYIKRRVRRYAPPPDRLIKRFNAVIDAFINVKDRHGFNLLTIFLKRIGIPLFTDDNKGQIDELRGHILKGCVSDPPGISLFFPDGKDRDGLQLWMCARGTNKNESRHSSIKNDIVSFGTGPELVSHLACNDRFRCAINSLTRYQPGFENIGHYDHFILDSIQLLTNELFGIPLFDWWPNSLQFYSPDETFGISPVLKDSTEPDKSEIKDLPPNLRYLAKCQRSAIPYLPVAFPKEKQLFPNFLSSYSGTHLLFL
jgi:hypothetical protein